MGNELFEKAPIRTAYLKLAIPVVLGMVVQLIYNMVDTYFIALTNNTRLIAGVSICAPLFTLMLAFGDLFALGGSSVYSRLLGAGKLDAGKRISNFCFYASLMFGVVIAALMLIFTNPILHVLGADAETIGYAGDYYRWIILGSPFIMYSLVPGNLLRAAGHPNASMIASILGAVVNMILDPIFIFGLGLGAAGAAIATIIGYICSDLFSTWFVAFRCKNLSIHPGRIKISGREVLSIFAIGLPSAVTNFMQTLGMTLTNRALVPYGNDSIAAMGIVLKVVNIVLLIIIGLAFGGQPLSGYVYGSGNRARLRKVLAFSYKIVGGSAAVLAVIFMIFARPVIRVFLSDAALVDQGAEMLRFQLPGMILMGVGLVTICTFQSMGKGLPSLLLSLCRQGVVYAICLFIMGRLFGYIGVLASQLAADIVTVFIAAVLFWLFIRPELKLKEV